ncbi:MAG TPA: hypothetical protein PKM25_02365 [Candidatus Ozemobacteraceae bacterium]|nr:hypothetical protein [Candidatus Ozemobacteraceae bacterium]
MMNDHEKNVKMARPDEDTTGNGQGHTIVGGRPSGMTDPGRGIPRGMELLLKRAAVDDAFCAELFAGRATVADSLAIPLDPAERAMLNAIPEAQLRGIITRTRVPETQKRALTGASAAAMLALLAQLTFTPVAGRADTPPDRGSSGELRPAAKPQLPNAGVSADESSHITRGIRPDFPMPPGGARPDLPEPQPPVVSPVTPDGIDNRVERPPASAAWKPGQSLSFEALQQIPVRAEVSGQPFGQAINRISADTGVTIQVLSIPSIDNGRPVETQTSGVPLGKALRRLCAEAAGEYALFEIEIGDTEVKIRFRPKSGAIQPRPLPDDPGAHITRGIRPDIPGSDK